MLGCFRLLQIIDSHTEERPAHIESNLPGDLSGSTAQSLPIVWSRRYEELFRTCIWVQGSFLIHHASVQARIPGNPSS